MSLFTEVM